MPDVLSTSASWVGGMFRRHASAQAVYSRGTATVAIPVHCGRAEIVVDGEVMRLSADWRTFFVTAADLVLPALGRITPAEGDRIEETRGTTVYVYEVMPPATGMPCYEPVGSAGFRLRIQAKLIETR